MSKELTDEMIIKMLECCIVDDCATCPIDCFECHIDGTIIYQKALNLINRLKKENAELKAENERLRKDNELLRNAKVVYESVDYCFEDLKKAEKRIAELEKENAKLKSTNTNILKGCDEYKNRHLKQFAESYRKKLDEQMRFYKNADIGYRDISITALNGAYKYLDETLKEFIND